MSPKSIRRKNKIKKKDIRVQTYPCGMCGQTHNIEIDFSKLTQRQKQGLDPVMNFVCPDAAFMYRVVNFVLDTRGSVFRDERLKEMQESTAKYFKADWGETNFNEKLERFKQLDISFLGVPEEYYDLLIPVVSSYCCGYYYPAMTSAGSLGERILNRLIIKTRDHYKSSPQYKKVWNKQSFEQWDYPVSVLKEWKVISESVSKLFLKLKKYRNDSIHYNDGYDFESNSHQAVKILTEIIDNQFNYMMRKDLFWVFDVPGEIWVRSAVTADPFVKEFVLPHCLHLTPFCEPQAKPPQKGKNVPLKPLSDEDFIRIRRGKIKNELTIG